MQKIEALIEETRSNMTICNACRYCEGFCPVFPAMERRRVFTPEDLKYLANLCHNCGECYYACQYAPPHEFAVNVPQSMAKLRAESYRDYAWPGPLAKLFDRNGLLTALALAVGVTLLLLIAVGLNGGRLLRADAAQRNSSDLRLGVAIRATGAGDGNGTLLE